MAEIALICLKLITEKRKKERREENRKWYRKLKKVNYKLYHMNRERQAAILEIKNCLNILSIEAEQLYHILIPIIENRCTPIKEDNIRAKQMLAMTLKYLTARESTLDLSAMYDVEEKIVKNIIIDTCKAIHVCLRHYLKFPSTEDDWKTMSKQFKKLRGFPNCIGATAMKHIAITETEDSKKYLNIKGQYSIIVYIFANAEHEIYYVESGFQGGFNGDDLFRHSTFLDKYLDESLNLPPYTAVENSDPLPYVFLGDNSFLLYYEVMVPFEDDNLTVEQEKYNRKWEHAKRVVDDAFELMASRFNILKKTIDFEVEDVNKIVFACTTLHNYMIKNIRSYVVTEDPSLPINVDRNKAIKGDLTDYQVAVDNRNSFVKYFNMERDTEFNKTKVPKTESMETKNLFL